MDIHLITSIIMYTSLGTGVGFLSGLLGVGGGGILVPLLASIFSYQGINEANVLPMALATSLACSLPTTATSAYSHHKKSAVLWQIVKMMSGGIIVGSIIGIAIATQLRGAYLAMIFSVFMLIVAIQMFADWQPQPRKKPMNPLTTLLVGVSIGLISAIISVGGAFFTILYLTYNNIDLKKAIGTSSAVGFIAVLFATLGYLSSGSDEALPLPYHFGYVYLPALCFVTLASVITVPVGAKLAHRLSNKRLKQILGVVCVLLSLKLVYSFI